MGPEHLELVVLGSERHGGKRAFDVEPGRIDGYVVDPSRPLARLDRTRDRQVLGQHVQLVRDRGGGVVNVARELKRYDEDRSADRLRFAVRVRDAGARRGVMLRALEDEVLEHAERHEQQQDQQPDEQNLAGDRALQRW